MNKKMILSGVIFEIGNYWYKVEKASNGYWLRRSKLNIYTVDPLANGWEFHASISKIMPGSLKAFVEIAERCVYTTLKYKDMQVVDPENHVPF